ncbi:MAG: hypothetical protein Q9167_006021 [Letrouitia subvulpina]
MAQDTLPIRTQPDAADTLQDNGHSQFPSPPSRTPEHRQKMQALARECMALPASYSAAWKARREASTLSPEGLQRLEAATKALKARLKRNKEILAENLRSEDKLKLGGEDEDLACSAAEEKVSPVDGDGDGRDDVESEVPAK